MTTDAAAIARAVVDDLAGLTMTYSDPNRQRQYEYEVAEARVAKAIQGGDLPMTNQHSGADIKALAKSLKRVIEQAENNAGTLAAKESVKLVPAHWHAVIDVGRQAADALASAIAELETRNTECGYLAAKVERAIAERDEARRMSDAHREHAQSAVENCASLNRLLSIAEARAEACLEELTRTAEKEAVLHNHLLVEAGAALNHRNTDCGHLMRKVARLEADREEWRERLEELTRERDAAITRCGEWAADFARKCVRLEEAKAVLERPLIYEIEDGGEIHLKLHGVEIGVFAFDSPEAIALLKFDAEARAFLHQGGSE